MLNAATTPNRLAPRASRVTLPVTQKVMIVNGRPDVLELIETLLDAGHYDVVFVESSEHAYSHIKRVRPDLVILCVGIDDVHDFQVLSMLKLDADTRSIPVLTYADYERDEAEEPLAERSEMEMFGPRTIELMN